MGKPSKWSDDEKRAALARVDEGETYEAVGRSMGISGAAVRMWRKSMYAAPKAKTPKATKKKASPKPDDQDEHDEDEVEGKSDALDGYAVADAWGAPLTLGQALIAIHYLCVEGHDDDTLETLEAAVARYRSIVARRAA